MLACYTRDTHIYDRFKSEHLWTQILSETHGDAVCNNLPFIAKTWGNTHNLWCSRGIILYSSWFIITIDHLTILIIYIYILYVEHRFLLAYCTKPRNTSFSNSGQTRRPDLRHVGEAFQQQGFGELGAKLAVVLAATESSHDQWPLGKYIKNGGGQDMIGTI